MSVTSRNTIVVSVDPRGRFHEGTLASGQTPKPGTVVCQASDGTWSVGTPGGTISGSSAPLTVVLEDALQGKSVGDAYADGSHVFLYDPANGEDLMMIVKDISGTGDTHAVGDLLSVDAATGKLVASTGNRSPFQLKEVSGTAGYTADTLSRCRVNLN